MLSLFGKSYCLACDNKVPGYPLASLLVLKWGGVLYFLGGIMKVLYAPNYKIEEKCVIAFGKFDGIHKGHVKLINTLVEEAKRENKLSVIYTFQEHPKAVLTNSNFKLLMSDCEKIKKIESLGVDVLVFEKFDKIYANMLPEEFVKNILIEKLNVKKVVIGSNSTFGRNSEGNVDLLRFFANKYKFEVIEVELLKENGHVISSSKIRDELAVGGGCENEIF